VVVHQLTALAGAFDLKHFDRYFAQTNRLRTAGTDNLLAAARAAGARRLVAQSYAGWPFAREGGPVKAEDAPFDPDPPRSMSQTLDAIRHVEAVAQAPGIEGVVLRYGGFYGPGTSVSGDGEMVTAIRQRKVPIVGNGAGVWSFVHIEDATAATVAAIEGGTPGLYHITDDEPAPVSAWLPELAAALGAKPPRRVPSWLARALIGEAGITMMTRIRGASNAKAKREFGWELRYPSWREGFRTGLGDPAAADSAAT
jgi:nucleoside-diphosphate-sugar epimerase